MGKCYATGDYINRSITCQHGGCGECDSGGTSVDGPAHTTFLLIRADEASQIERVLAPVIDLGWTETRPVVDFADIMSRVTAEE